MAADKADSKGQAWFCTTGLASDVVIEVGDMSFHLHKFPLMYRSKKLHFLVTEAQSHRTRRSAAGPVHEIEEEGDDNTDATAVPETDDDDDDNEDGVSEEELHISLPDFPGGTEAFEVAAKFCYGGKIELTPSNVVPLRCAAEFLEMTDDASQDNLVSRTEKYLSQSVLRSLRESVRALRSCDEGNLLAMAEDLGIVQRCVDSIAGKASASDPASLFGWPMGEAGFGGGSGGGGLVVPDRRASDRALWSGLLDGRSRRKNAAARGKSAKDNKNAAAAAVLGDLNSTPAWFEDLTALSLPLYKRVIAAMKASHMSPDVIEGALISYARRCLPGLSRTSRKSNAAAVPPSQVPSSEQEQADLLETIITNLPLQKTAACNRTTTRFLFGLLRTVKILHASEESREALERKIGMQLEHAMLDDLLMPSYSYTMETLYDVDCVERLLAYFLEEEGSNAAAGIAPADDGDDPVGAGGGQQGGDIEGTGRGRKSPLVLVGRLIDGFLSEIASDINLKPDKFCSLAFSLPDQARVYDDGLYRAVDIYLKSHPRLSEAEKERISSVMDCQKLTLEACTHAAQNERLPLRAIVQVLFFEQLQLRHAIAGSFLATDPTAAAGGAQQLADSTVRMSWNDATARSALRDNQVLRIDMDSMRTRVQELEKECTTMKKAIEKIDKSVASATGDGGAGWKLGKKFGCKFRTQVCDSQERNIVEARKFSRPEEQSTA